MSSCVNLRKTGRRRKRNEQQVGSFKGVKEKGRPLSGSVLVSRPRRIRIRMHSYILTETDSYTYKNQDTNTVEDTSPD